MGKDGAKVFRVKRRTLVWGEPLLLAALVAALLVGLAWIAQSFLWDYAVDDITGSHMAALNRDAFLIETRLRSRANDMFFLKRVAEAELALNPKALTASDNLRSAVTTMMLARSQYDQIRLLDLSGHEEFRYNWKGGQHPLQEVAAGDLQDKSDRTYFIETLAASGDDVVFSSLDLNVEHGQIEQPLKPMLRISGQILGPDRKPRAVLVLNYLGDQLLRELKQDQTQSRRYYLLNESGYWLVGPSEESQWGFMYPPKKGCNLRDENPELWKKLTGAKSGWLTENGYLYCFQNIDPLGATTDYPPVRMPVQGGERLKWTLLVKVPDAAIWKSVAGIRRGIWGTCAGGILVLVPLVWFGGISLERRRQDMREVREARTMLDSVIETSPHGIVVMEAIRDEQKKIADLRIVLSNKMALELMGRDLPPGKQDARTMLKDYPESKQSGSYAAFCSVIETGKPVVFEEFYNSRNIRKWFSFRAAKREDGVVVTLVDITPRKEAEEKLHQSEQIQRMAGHLSKVGGWVVEYPEARIYWTEESCRLREVPFDFVPTIDSSLAFYAPEYQPKIREAFQACVRDGTPYDLETEIITAKGNRIWVRTMAHAEFNEGKLIRVVGALQDITAAKNALLREQDLRHQAQAAERAKSEFLAVMSHEIRTPMNGVIGMTGILADSELTETQRDCVNTIQASGEALLTVINDILDFSKIESGMMDLESRPFNLRQCLEETIDLFTMQIRKKGIEAAYLIAPEVPVNLVGDSNRLRQILINLIGNAVKFTERGEIILKVEQQSHDDKGFHLLFSVRDTGIGISKDGADKLFQSFQQVDSSTTRRYGGTGLGLVISRRLAELMDGRMWVESELGVGSTFFFTIVLRAASLQATLSTGDGSGLTARPALIVDDNATNRQILELQLKAWGMQPVAVSSGMEAIEKMKEKTFDVILLDLQMPEMDGVMLAQEIRKNSQVPLLLLSSSGQIEVGEAGKLFQFQIPKPVKQSLLFDALQQVIGGFNKKSAEKKFEETMASRLPLRILLAEDNSVNQKVGRMMLAKLGYKTDMADNGLQVLESLKKTGYDVIFMDIQMPEMDGIEATRLLREKLGTKCPYIIALTANALEGDREKFLGLGFDYYLSKPLSPERLRGALESVPRRPEA